MKTILFIQGAGSGAYEEDKIISETLKTFLDSKYEIRYPKMPGEENARYELWKKKIETELALISGDTILIGHSVGASILMKCLTEINILQLIKGIFLLAGPFWGGKGWHYKGYEKLELPENTEALMPNNVPIFIYHSQNDEIVPFEHLALYSHLLPQATMRKVEKGGHQFNKQLAIIADDIQTL